MKIEHIAIWANNLELMKDFYVRYFQMNCNDKYTNPKKQFSSYFLSFKNQGCRIELMHNPNISKQLLNDTFIGMHHFAISLGSKQMVDELTLKLQTDGYSIHSQPRTTGDGYYESVILDPEGNKLELTN